MHLYAEFGIKYAYGFMKTANISQKKHGTVEIHWTWTGLALDWPIKNCTRVSITLTVSGKQLLICTVTGLDDD